jgi:hypothetical protein
MTFRKSSHEIEKNQSENQKMGILLVNPHTNTFIFVKKTKNDHFAG